MCILNRRGAEIFELNNGIRVLDRSNFFCVFAVQLLAQVDLARAE